MSEDYWKICSRCGKRWHPWYCSGDFHASCALTDEQADVALVRLKDPHLTQKALAAELGITPNVLRACLAKATHRAGKFWRR